MIELFSDVLRIHCACEQSRLHDASYQVQTPDAHVQTVIRFLFKLVFKDYWAVRLLDDYGILHTDSGTLMGIAPQAFWTE